MLTNLSKKLMTFMFIAYLLIFSRVVYAEIFTYTYDELNRLTKVDYGSGTSITYTYDAAGNRLTITAVVNAATPAPSPTTTTTKTPPSTQPPPTPSPKPTASLTPSPTPTATSGTGIIYGFVNDEEKFPLRNVSMALTGPNNYSESSNTDEDGYYFFENLAAGDYTLRASKSEYQSVSIDISLKGGEIYEVRTIMMEETRSGYIYGFVRDIKGDPVENVRLTLKGIKTKYIDKTASDRDGFFDFTGLDADTYVLKAKKKRYRPSRIIIKLEDLETKEVEIEMNRTSRIKALSLEKSK